MKMDLEKQLEDLNKRKRDLQKSLSLRKKEFLDLQKEKKRTLEKQIRRAQARLSAAQRKQRTRRLIVLGSVLEKQHSHPELIVLLDHALDRDQDRALFDLPPRSGASQAPPTAPLEGWRPTRLPDDSWGSLYAGTSPQALPSDLVGLTITVRARNGKSWNATVTEVLERSPDRVLVRTQRTSDEPAESKKTS